MARKFITIMLPEGMDTANIPPDVFFFSDLIDDEALGDKSKTLEWMCRYGKLMAHAFYMTLHPFNRDEASETTSAHAEAKI